MSKELQLVEVWAGGLHIRWNHMRRSAERKEPKVDKHFINYFEGSEIAYDFITVAQ